MPDAAPDGDLDCEPAFDGVLIARLVDTVHQLLRAAHYPMFTPRQLADLTEALHRILYTNTHPEADLHQVNPLVWFVSAYQLGFAFGSRHGAALACAEAEGG